MTTISEGRTAVSLKIPEPLAALFKVEAEAMGISMAALARRAVQWHRGEGLARHPDRPPTSLPDAPSSKTVTKGVLLDEADAIHLDQAGGRVGLARTATLLLILVQYLGMDPLPPLPGNQ